MTDTTVIIDRQLTVIDSPTNDNKFVTVTNDDHEASKLVTPWLGLHALMLQATEKSGCCVKLL